jgi:protoporphyrinogen oxidase
MRVVILGSGAMGLAAAFHATRAGHDVIVLEADSQPWGMAAHFDFGGLSIERYYHFICKSDQPTFELLRELGIDHKKYLKLKVMAHLQNQYSWVQVPSDAPIILASTH